MQGQKRTVFLHEVVNLCNRAVRLLNAVNEEKAKGRDVDRLFDYLDLFLSTTANIAKLLWGIEKWLTPAQIEERLALRRELGIADNSPISDWTVRNKLEHIDEYFDKWASQGTPGIMDRNVMPRESLRNHTNSPQTELMNFRQFNPTTDRYYLWTYEVDIQALGRELQLIGVAASTLEWRTMMEPFLGRRS